MRVAGALVVGGLAYVLGRAAGTRTEPVGTAPPAALDGADDDLEHAWLSWDLRVWRVLVMRDIAARNGDAEALAATTRQLHSLGCRP